MPALLRSSPHCDAGRHENAVVHRSPAGITRAGPPIAPRGFRRGQIQTRRPSLPGGLRGSGAHMGRRSLRSRKRASARKLLPGPAARVRAKSRAARGYRSPPSIERQCLPNCPPDPHKNLKKNNAGLISLRAIKLTTASFTTTTRVTQKQKNAGDSLSL